MCRATSKDCIVTSVPQKNVPRALIMALGTFFCGTDVKAELTQKCNIDHKSGQEWTPVSSKAASSLPDHQKIVVNNNFLVIYKILQLSTLLKLHIAPLKNTAV